MLVSAIVAMDKNKVIGVNNEIPWYLPADFRYFKRKTIDHHIIMGRKCFDSIGKPLPKRTNIILTRNPYFIATGCLVYHTLEEALGLAYDNKEEECFIIGGSEIYKLAWKYLDRLYITEVDTEVSIKEGDDVVYFPDLEVDKWQEVSSKTKEADEKNEHNYTFKVYEPYHKE